MSSKKKLSKRERKWGWTKFFLFFWVLVFAMLLGGFLSFAQHIDGLTTPRRADIPKADGIVVWTGKGGGRLEAAGQLLLDHKGERLFISGVNTQIDADKIAELAGLPAETTHCCVDLDYAAINTLGNARETAAWAEALDYKHIILVTSAYHMPRAQVEISTAAGRMRITPFPVMRDDPAKWYQDGTRFKRILREYSKLLVSYARGRSQKQPVQAPIMPPLESSSEQP